LFEWESVRFDECSMILRKLLQSPKEESEFSDRCGVVYSDIPLPQTIKIQKNISLAYHGRIVANNAQVHLIAVYPPKSIDIFLIPNLSEAIACILSFSFRTRFTSSRDWGNLKDENLRKPMDLFLRMASAFAGPLSIHPISPDGIRERLQVFHNVIESLRKISLKNYKRILRSFRLYQLALLTYPMDVGLAYSLLVSAIDNLSLKSGNVEKFVDFIIQYLPKTWASFDSRAWEEDRWLDSITPWKRSILDSYKERFGKNGEKVLDPLKGILSENAFQRLMTYLKENEELSPQEKRAYEHILNHWYLYRIDMKITQKELPDMLKRIYREVRSAFFHGGRSPPESTIDRYETAPIKPKFKKNGTVSWQRDIPSFNTFERITHDSILAYVEAISK